MGNRRRNRPRRRRHRRDRGARRQRRLLEHIVGVQELDQHRTHHDDRQADKNRYDDRCHTLVVVFRNMRRV